ncbi:hypothetical protein MB14_14690 [Roseivirga ehrenbergii]|uniref:Uncharacterized protein n=2 Tax=Roseivirga ehrenbergii (strain DSM 102268 / JCM 13514 / KCTC 12282 / NCIMB 14502 / KMM 6017) TaxID=279360 RepID=A0A150XQV6_ROSEK|nr:hypothetical protein MB14_14690 [Roseivirga ehrenbergii]
MYTQGFFWVDDSRIIFQVVENLYQGFGPVYTQGDRFQVHSSPLWVYYLFFFRVFTSDYSHIILLSSSIPLICVILWFRFKYYRHSFFFLLVLFLSNGLFSFWGSGLDNPLAYALMTVLIYAFSKENVKLFIFISALLLVNRLDAALYIVPLAFWFICKFSLRENVINFIKFGWPFYLHLLFSFIYYGSIFPNAYYAKITSISITMSERITTFAKYTLPIIAHSPLEVILILAPFLLFLIFQSKLLKNDKYKALLGLTSYSLTLFYIFWVGFDQFNPRLWGVPLFFGLLLVIDFFAPLLHQKVKMSEIKVLIPIAIASIIALTVAFHSTYLPINKIKLMRQKGTQPVLKYNSDLNMFADIQVASSELRILNGKHKEKLERPEMSTLIVSMVSEAGTVLEIGSNVHLVDKNGLADPLMARIKSTQPYYAPGHNYRPIPRGYPESLITGTNQIVNPALAAYYDRLKNVISGKILSASRFKDILYLLTHEVPIDPNDPKYAGDFLSPQEYEQIFEEDYGIYKRLHEFEDEFTYYSLNGIKSKGFTSSYWGLDKLLPPSTQNTLKANLNDSKKLVTSGPFQYLRHGVYVFEIQYKSSLLENTAVGTWEISVMAGNEHEVNLKKGEILGTQGELGKISDNFTLDTSLDMAKLNIKTYVEEGQNLIIQGIRLTKLKASNDR